LPGKHIMGDNLKNACQKWKELIVNTKMAKFEAPGINEKVNDSLNFRES